jgi:hypothetical protein
VPSPESLELTVLKAKNAELFQQLQSAEDFITEQETRIQGLIKQ